MDPYLTIGFLFGCIFMTLVWLGVVYFSDPKNAIERRISEWLKGKSNKRARP